MDRARVVELRSEATSEIAAARAKEDRLRAQETARAEAETRAAAYGADAEIRRLQVRFKLESFTSSHLTLTMQGIVT